MRNRKLSHRSFVTRPLGLERLQDRDLLAGNVSAFMDRGTLIVTGDIGDNELRITQVAPNWVQLTSMSSPTTINNNQSTATFKVTKGMIFNMGGGNDVLQFDGITMKQKNDLVVDMGVGDDNLQFNNMNVLRIRSILGEGHDSATVTNSKVQRSLNIFGAGGDDQITLANSKFGEKSVMDGNGGANFINQSNVKFGRKLQSLNLTFGTRPPLTPAQILTAGTDAETATEGQVNAEFNVIENDIPTTGATLDLSSLTITDGPDFGTASFNTTTGKLIYTHNGTENFTDKITYTIKDSSGRTATGTVNITITSVNEAPTGAEMQKSVATGKEITFTVTATDPEGQLDADSTLIGTAPTSGTATVNADGSIKYVHNGAAGTSDQFTYTIKDAQGNTSAPIVVKITVVTDNTAPAGTTDAATVAEGGNIPISVLTNDSDANGLDAKTVKIGTQPANGTVSVNATTGVVTYTHNGGETATDTFTYTVKDTLGTESAPITVNITVTPVNDTPVAVGESVNATRSAATIINVATNDTDAEGPVDLTSIEIVTNPTHGTAVKNNDGTVTYTNDGNAATTDSFTYRIKDSAGVFSNTVTVNITVTAAGNQAPVAGNDEQTVAEGASATITVLADDEDPDGTLNVSTVTIVGNPTNGTAVAQANGTIIYTHNGSETITDTFTYTVKDNQGLVSNTATVTITITPVNDGPVAVADAANVANGGSVSFSVSTNDTDPEGDDLNLTEVVIVTQPANGTVVENNDGTVTYTHNGSATTTDSFTYTIKDEFGAVSNTVTVTITVGAAVNDPPVAANDSANVDEGDDVVIDVSDNDSDPENDLDLGSIVQVTAPANGTVVVNGDGTVTYTHNGSETTTDSFTYTISDGDGVVSNTATVTITIAPINDLPVAVADADEVDEGGSVTVNVATNDTDADGTVNPASLAIVTQGANGTAVANNDGTITYTHNGSEGATDTFTYTIADNNGAVSNTVTVTITVNGVNDAPVANSDVADVNEEGSVIIDVADNDVDPENDLDLTSIVITQQPLHGTLTNNDDGTITYLHDGSESLSDSFSYTIKDANGLVSGVATVTITIAPVNDAPLAANEEISVTEDSGVNGTGDVLSNDSDPDGDAISVSAVDGLFANVGIDVPGQYGTFHINSDGTFTYDLDDTNVDVNALDNLEELLDSITYAVSDGVLATTATLSVKILGNTD